MAKKFIGDEEVLKTKKKGDKILVKLRDRDGRVGWTALPEKEYRRRAKFR